MWPSPAVPVLLVFKPNVEGCQSTVYNTLSRQCNRSSIFETSNRSKWSLPEAFQRISPDNRYMFYILDTYKLVIYKQDEWKKGSIENISRYPDTRSIANTQTKKILYNKNDKHFKDKDICTVQHIPNNNKCTLKMRILHSVLMTINKGLMQCAALLFSKATHSGHGPRRASRLQDRRGNVDLWTRPRSNSWNITAFPWTTKVQTLEDIKTLCLQTLRIGVSSCWEWKLELCISSWQPIWKHLWESRLCA